MAAAAGGAAVLLDSLGIAEVVALPALTERAVVDQINEVLPSLTR